LFNESFDLLQLTRLNVALARLHLLAQKGQGLRGDLGACPLLVNLEPAACSRGRCRVALLLPLDLDLSKHAELVKRLTFCHCFGALSFQALLDIEVLLSLSTLGVDVDQALGDASQASNGALHFRGHAAAQAPAQIHHVLAGHAALGTYIKQICRIGDYARVDLVLEEEDDIRAGLRSVRVEQVSSLLKRQDIEVEQVLLKPTLLGWVV
jgi:aryl carrier-like protein